MQKKLSNIHLIFPLDFLGDSSLDLPKFWMLGGIGCPNVDWYKVGRCSQGVVLFIVCQSGVSLYVEINYVVLNVLYQASVFGNIFCVL